MDNDIAQLVEMGATPAQARAALKKHKEVMEAAGQIFDGKFDHVVDDDGEGGGDVEMVEEAASHYHHHHHQSRLDGKRKKAATASEDSGGDDARGGDGNVEEEDEEGEEEGENGDEYEYDEEDFDYGSEPDLEMDARGNAGNADPYAGIFFSKDRREEVIEVEEEPETVIIQETVHPVRLMTQSEWMKGCPEGGEQGFLFSLYNELSYGSCPCPTKCGYEIVRMKGDFFPILPSFSAYVDRLRNVIHKECPRCVKTFCFACGEPVTLEGRNTFNDDNAMFHCSNLQGVLLGVGLFMLEQQFMEQNTVVAFPEPVVEDKSRNAKRRKTSASPSPSTEEDEEYYIPSLPGGVKPRGGTGYAGAQKEDTTGQDQALLVQYARDEKISRTLNDIRVYLPSVNRGRTSDYLVHPTALAHLRRRFNYISSSLLRNDSLADMSDRSVLYFELFEWLETISRHEALASMMAMPIMVLVYTKPISRKASAKSRLKERILVYEGSSGPRELLESIYIQAEAALKSLESQALFEAPPLEMTEEEKRVTNVEKGKFKEEVPARAEENVQMLSFCHRIQSTVKAIDRALEETKGKAFVERLHASLPKIPSSSMEAVYVQAGNTEEETKKAYIEWATRVRFEYCDLTISPEASDQSKDKSEEDLQPHYKFYYNSDARMMAKQDIPKRSLAIAKELAVLTTNLPVAWDSSIFLRVDEVRVDVIKALIVGPEGTPYSNGCFLFDIFLPSTYNSSPPHVKYMTTYGGKYRFNPNLYADGKVCLSLLGTWAGPGWVSGKSTLLQVLISIQSMILCDEPYVNEPGWASSGGTPQSKAYSANVRRMVVKAAMLGNLLDCPEPFEDVIRTHFRLKARSISAQLDKWLEEDDGGGTAGDGAMVASKNATNSSASGSSNGFRKDVEDLKLLMNTL